MQCLDDAKQELKRVDHLIFVSLKYTRTTDVLINIVLRMIDAYNYLLEALLKKAVENKEIDYIPTTPMERVNTINEVYDDPEIKEHTAMYLLFRQISRNDYSSENEYRRHVTLITYISGRREILNIDLISVYYENILKLCEKINNMVNPKKDE